MLDTLRSARLSLLVILKFWSRDDTPHALRAHANDQLKIPVEAELYALAPPLVREEPYMPDWISTKLHSLTAARAEGLQDLDGSNGGFLPGGADPG